MSVIIFDFDGTIADSLPVVIDIFHDLTHQKKLDQQEMIRLRQLPLRDIAGELHIAPWRIPFLLWRGRRTMSKRVNEIGIIAGIPALIDKLFKRGNQLYIVSSNDTRTIKRFLKTHKLNNYFTQIYGGIGLFSKARSLQKVLRLNSIDRENCYYIGDEIRDIEAAKQTNIKVIAVTWGYNDKAVLEVYDPTALATTPLELLEVLNEN